MRRNVSRRARFRVLRRGRFRCHYCGASAADVALEIDHVVPVARGGTNAESNLVPACLACNRGKADTSAGETFDAWLRLQAGRDDIVGDLADDFVRAPLADTSSLRALLASVRRAVHVDPTPVERAAWHAWREWKRGRPTLLVQRMRNEHLERIHGSGCCWAKGAFYVDGRRFPLTDGAST